MNSYFSTFITGFDRVVEKALAKSLKDIQIELLTDGLVIYKTTVTPDEIKKIKFLNNSFVLLKKVDRLSASPTLDMVKILLKDKDVENYIKKYFSERRLKFRIRASVRNQFVAIDKNLQRNLEDKIMQTVPTLTVDRSLPDIELLIATRSESFGLIGMQFTHRTNYEKVLEKGELYPELAYILCLISDPHKDDVFLDPFAGHGSIPIQRTVSFPYKQVVAGDNDPILVERLRKKTTKLNKKIVVEKLDALNLSKLEDASVNKIVTDPPWGLHEGKNLDLPRFYSRMLEEFHRVIKPSGAIVIITAQKELVEEQLSKLKGRLEIVAKYNTLVSGKKAGVYKIGKIGRYYQ